jgi:creatinine amidohydrolase
MLARYPDLVLKDRIANFPSAAAGMSQEFRWLSASRPAPFAWMAQDLNPSGAVGNAQLATIEKGNALLDHGARAFCELLSDVQAFDLVRLGNTVLRKS